MEINPYQGTLHGRETAEPKPWQFRPILLGCLAVIGILVVFAMLLVDFIRPGREPGRRIQCANNLKMIALALKMYEEEYGVLPPAHTVNAEGKPLHSWRTLILPYMEQEALFRKIDLSKPWDDPANKEAFDAMPSFVYGCPSANLPPTHTVYMAVALPRGCFLQTAPRKLSEITDGHNLTLMVMEVDEKQAVHWMSPTDFIDLGFLDPKSGTRLAHIEGIQAAFVDGEVRFLNAKLKPETIRALITIDGKDDAVAPRED